MWADVRGCARRNGLRLRTAARAWIAPAALVLGSGACEAIVGVDFDAAVLDPGGQGGTCEPGALEPCYEGAEGTLGVGLCVAGSRTCGDDSMWGPCEGQVVPRAEDTSVPGDENCDGTAEDCHWARRFGDAEEQRVTAIAVTADGTSFITGHFNGTIDFGDGLLQAQSSDAFLARFDRDGVVVWSKQLGGPAEQESFGLAAYHDGGVVVGGRVNGPIDLGNGPLSPMGGGTKAFLARYTAGGGLVWGRLLGGPPSSHTITTVAASPTGLIAVGGFCGQSIDFGNASASCASAADMFVALLDAGGDAVWIKPFGNQAGSSALDVHFDAEGDVLATGMIYGLVDFDGQMVGSANELTAVLLEMDGAAGDVDWVKALGRTGPFVPVKTAVDAQGDILVAKSLLGDFDFGNGCPPATGGDGLDVTVIKLDGGGSCLWSQHFGAPGDQIASGMTVDQEGNIIIGGFYKGPVDFGLGEQFPEGIVDAFLVKLGPSGEPLWGRSFGDDMDSSGELPDTTASVGVDGMGNVYATGSFDGNVDFCNSGITLSSAGRDDLFLAKYAP